MILLSRTLKNGHPSCPITSKYHPNSRCINGQKIVYYRRKPTSACFIADNFKLFKVVGTCPCTQVDWDCDVGFSLKDSVCMADGGLDPSQPPKDCSDYYDIKSGYVKARDTHCSEGVIYHEMAANCPKRNMQM